MRKTVFTIAMSFSLIMIASSCGKHQDDLVEGLKPIYAAEDNLENVEISNSASLENPGRIYLYDNMLLVNEQGKGIHIYDNSNPNAPTEASFIGIPGNMDFSVREGMLYADNVRDMVIINISNPTAPVYENRIENVFPIQEFPDEHCAFECVDPSKGIVVGWEKTTLQDPKCFR